MQHLRLKLGENVAKIISNHNGMAMVVANALGPADGKKGKTQAKPGADGVKDLAAGYASAEQAIAAINQAMLI